jgi:hypothetical protein
MGECGASRFLRPSDQALLSLLVTGYANRLSQIILFDPLKAETLDSNLLGEALCGENVHNLQ